MDDNDIIDLFFARREDALLETRQKYGRRLLFTAMNILHNAEDAEECVSDTLWKTWETIPPTRPTMFGAFLSKITRNLSLNLWKAQHAIRRGGGEVELLLGELEDCIPAKEVDTPETAYESQVLTETINDCLRSMDQTARIAFVLRYFHGESIQSVCTQLNMSESKAKSLLFRTRNHLKAYLEKEGIVR
ncbi:MAG: sigma-70 family RNA polymerase sigma factor [Oscillospiraceae bacterium]|nr:sigma-70 family RNA polymerase sigma factor [Oscillospiraceae bacterium]